MAKIKASIGKESSITGNVNSSWNVSLLVSLFFLVVLTYFIFSGANDHDFVNWDDQVYVEEQTLVLEKDYAQLWHTPVSLNYHPLTMISLAMQVPKNKNKLEAGVFIFGNILLHISNVLLVFGFVYLLTNKKAWVALAVAAIFGLHPMHIESIVWVSERKDVLYTFFFLIAGIMYCLYLIKDKKRYVLLTLIFFITSCLSKAMAVSFPLVMVLIDYWFDRQLFSKKSIVEKIPFFAISLLFGLIAINVQSGGDFHGMLALVGEKTTAMAQEGSMSMWQRLQVAAFGFWDYIIKFFYPYRISTFHPYPDGYSISAITGIISLLGCALLAFACVYKFSKKNAILFGLGFYLVTIMMVLQFLSVGVAITADRYTYVPYIGLAFGVVYTLYHSPLSESIIFRKVSSVVLGIYILILSITTYDNIKVWENSETLWTNVLHYYPQEDLALANRGNFRGKNGNIVGAMEDFEKALSDGCTRADVYEGLGNSYGVMSQQQPNEQSKYIAQSISMYQKAIQLEPNKPNIRYNLAISLLPNRPDTAAIVLQDAIHLAPYKEKEWLPVLAIAQLNAQQYEASVQTGLKCIEKGITTDNVYLHKGLALYGSGKKAEGLADIQKALQINPNNTVARDRLAQLRVQ